MDNRKTPFRCRLVWIVAITFVTFNLTSFSVVKVGSAEKAISELQTQTIGTFSPMVMNVSHTPLYPQPFEKVVIKAEVANDSGSLKSVVLVYREKLNYNWFGIHRYWGVYEWAWEPFTWDVYTDWIEAPMRAVQDGTYEAELLELPYYSTVWYKVCVIDASGISVFSEVYMYNVVNGTKTIINTEANDLITWFLYTSVGFLLVRGLSGVKRANDKQEADVSKVKNKEDDQP